MRTQQSLQARAQALEAAFKRALVPAVGTTLSTSAGPGVANAIIPILRLMASKYDDSVV